jgi:hypothetical protein
VEHRHLLPDEINLLVDGEEGFGVAPLAAHVENCDACRAELEAQQGLMASLERLPHFAPSPLFAHRVMTQVQVFEPWYVAVGNTVARLVPRSRTGRVLAAATAMVMAITLTLASVWIATNADAVVFLATVAIERVRAAGLDALGALVAATLGDAGTAALPLAGSGGLTVALTTLLLTVVAAALGIRQLAVASRRRRK